MIHRGSGFRKRSRMSSSTSAVLLKKRERTQNWIPEEKNALFSLIKAHVNAIENKKIDAAASAMKNLAWQQIHCAFRGRFSTDRDITRMREQWRRMKAQARMEMYTFVETVKTVGPEKAAKCRPSNLSIEVWKLIERTRKSDPDGERSDENCQDGMESSVNLEAILDKVTTSAPETSFNEIKVEADSDDYSTDGEASLGEPSSRKPNSFQKKRLRISEDEPMDLAEQKASTVDDPDRPFDNEEATSVAVTKERNDPQGDQEESVQRATWRLEVAQREHDLRLRTLSVELERAELQKQAAINELKTSEIKRQLIESQAAEYYSRIRMSGGEPGSGAGRGGGGGGSIREAGGSFGRMEAAHEDQYFYNLQKEQFKKLKEDLHDEISFHEEQIKRHQEAINRHKQRITEMDKA